MCMSERYQWRPFMLSAALAMLAGSWGVALATDIDDGLRKSMDLAVDKVKPALVLIHVVSVRYDEGRAKKFDGYGSGTIIDKRGFILTNHHVAGHPARLFCVMSDKEELEAELVGTDPATDLTVIRLKTDGSREFPVAAFGDSSALRVGDRVLAMGCPISISQSVTLGIVCNTEMVMPRLYAKYRMVFEMDGEDVGSLVRWIAHDASIYPGNSGGPLVNLNGEIVGVNEISMGLAGAIPANLARGVAGQLMAGGSVTRAWLGVELQPQLKHAGTKRGVLVGGVISGSPAEKAGLQSGDLLVRLNGQDTEARFREQIPLLQQVLADLPIGRELEAVVVRNGVEKTLKITAMQREPMELRTSELKPWGITVRNLSLLAAKELKRESRDGVLVTSLRPGGPCGESKPSLEIEDIILGVAGKPVRNVEELLAITGQITAGKKAPVPTLVEFERKSDKCVTVVNVGLEELDDPGTEVRKAWLDISTQVLTPPMAEQFGVAGRKGVRITDVYKGGKAAAAGLRVGDLLTALDGDPIAASNPEDSEVFPNMIRQYAIGATVELSLLRSNREAKIRVELSRSPMLAREMKKFRDDRFDLTVRDIAFTDRTDNKWEEGQRGVYIEEVKPGGWASLGNMAAGDVILEIGAEKTPDVAGFESVMDRIEVEKPRTLVFHLLNGIHHEFVELEPDWGNAAAAVAR